VPALQIQKCMPVDFNWGPVRAKNAVTEHDIFALPPLKYLMGIHFCNVWET
jgi:hypothetical protein